MLSGAAVFGDRTKMRKDELVGIMVLFEFMIIISECVCISHFGSVNITEREIESNRS